MAVLQDSAFFLKPPSHMSFMPSSPRPPRAGWIGSPRARQTWGLSKPPASALQSLLLCASSLPQQQGCSPLSLGFHCSSLSPQTAKVSSLWKVFNFWIKLEARLLILCRASADLPPHSPWSELATSSSHLSWFYKWPILHPCAAGVPLPRGRIHTKQRA